MEGWQPIDSAPKDGTDVLLWDADNGLVLVGRYVDFKGKAPVGYRDGWCDDYRGDYILERLTHWMPLPDPPSR